MGTKRREMECGAGRDHFSPVLSNAKTQSRQVAKKDFFFMSELQNNPLRTILREAYDKYAQERETSEMQGWKIEEREKFLLLLQRKQKKTLLEIGTGTGRDAKFFQDQGLETVCIDLSPALLQPGFLRARGPPYTFRLLCLKRGLHQFRGFQIWSLCHGYGRKGLK